MKVHLRTVINAHSIFFDVDVDLIPRHMLENYGEVTPDHAIELLTADTERRTTELAAQCHLNTAKKLIPSAPQ